MAQNTFINVTLDPGAATKDPSQHQHKIAGSLTTSAGDLTLSYDSAKITTLNLLDSAFRAARLRAIGSGLS